VINLLFGLIIIGGLSFWLYQNWETFDSSPEKPKISEEEQKLNRKKRNPYFDDDNY
jgi:hypothetical protein